MELSTIPYHKLFNSARWSHPPCNRQVVSASTSRSGDGMAFPSQARYPCVLMDSAFCFKISCVPSVPCRLHHTGSSAFLRPPPALSSACCMYGPTNGMFPANPLIVEKKSPKSTNMPYNSIRKPVMGHRRIMSMMPVAKPAVPFNFWRLAKKTAVFWRPIIRVRPRRKRICSQKD